MDNKDNLTNEPTNTDEQTSLSPQQAEQTIEPTQEEQQAKTSETTEISQAKEQKETSETTEVNEQAESNLSKPEGGQNDTASLQQSTEVQKSQSLVLGISEKHKRKTGLIIAVAVIILAIIASGIFFLFTNKKPDATTVSVDQEKIYPLGAEFSLVEGQVQISSNGTQWQDAKVSNALKENNFIKTAQDGRAIITLDDGSAIRLNNNTKVKIDKLTTKTVAITNESGEVYSRLVKSDRQFLVTVADESYKALGTAYLTANTPTSKGVQVYESKVKLQKANIEVPQGKYYLSESGSVDEAKQIKDLSIEALKQSSFITWNYQQDKSINEFKDKLGYLSNLEETATTPTNPSTPTPATNNNASPSLTLSGTTYDSGVKLSWGLNGISAQKGFKVVKGLSPNPTFGKDDAIYISNPNERNYSWKITDGKTYHFRVCIYSGEGCTAYSNNITLTAPKKQETSSNKSVPSGSLTLTHTGGSNFSWTLNGSAPYGYKLVWASGSQPIYPGSDYQYHSSQETKNGNITSKSGTYNVRVCMYNTSGVGDKCLNYSNQITVNIP